MERPTIRLTVGENSENGMFNESTITPQINTPAVTLGSKTVSCAEDSDESSVEVPSYYETSITPRITTPTPSLSPIRISSCDDSDDSSDGVPSNYETAVTPPITSPTVTLGPIVVNAGGTGVLHGNVNSYTLNQYIVPVAQGKDTEWTSNSVQHLVTDAVQLSTDTKKKFFPSDDTQVLSGDKETIRSLQRKWCLLISILIGLCLFTLLSTVLFTMGSGRSGGGLPFSGDQTKEVGMEGADFPGAPTLMSRTSWVAQPATGPLDDNDLPADMVVVCHTATEPCNNTASCILSVRSVQMFHIESRGWYDIGFNYLVGGDNYVYVGRGWDKMGAHTKGYNNATVGIAFMGTYDNQLPPQKQIEAFNKLLALGVRLGKLTADYKLVAQCQLKNTIAPGAALVKEMATWPHYDSSLPTTGCSSLQTTPSTPL